MEVHKIIDDLRFSLEHSFSEDMLLHVITDQTAALRQSFRLERSAFSPIDIEFLKSLRAISSHLSTFIELKEELPDVDSIDEYATTMQRLVSLKNALASFPVGKRVGKEIRELNERLPSIRALDKANKEFRFCSRIADLEQDACRCARNHPMIIRKGTHGHFWGCSKFPFCMCTSPLTSLREEALYC